MSRAPRRPGGYVKISRALFDPTDPFWGESRTFSRAEAWLDLLQMTAWRAERRRMPRGDVALARGEVAASVRHLGDRWGWSKSAVERFLSTLERSGRVVSLRVERTVAIYVVTNFDAADAAPDTPSEPLATVEPGHSRKGLTISRDTTSAEVVTAERDTTGTLSETLSETLDGTISGTLNDMPTNELGTSPETLSGPLGGTSTGTLSGTRSSTEAGEAGKKRSRGGAPRSAGASSSGSGVPTTKYPHFAKADCDALYAHWSERVGVPKYDRFRAALAPLFVEVAPRYPVPTLVAAIDAYREVTEGENRWEFNNPSPERFVQAVAEWVRLGALPAVSVTGEMTERTMRALGYSDRPGGRAA